MHFKRNLLLCCLNVRKDDDFMSSRYNLLLHSFSRYFLNLGRIEKLFHNKICPSDNLSVICRPQMGGDDDNDKPKRDRFSELETFISKTKS